MTRLRFWLSGHLLSWALKLIPDQRARLCMSTGINIGLGLMTGELTMVKEVKDVKIEPAENQTFH